MLKLARMIMVASTLGVAITTLSACSVMRDQTTVGGYVDDKVTTARVKTRLLEDKATSGLAINVDTLDGIVALSGFAKSATEKAEAGRVARETPGVREVRNNLIVRPS